MKKLKFLGAMVLMLTLAFSQTVCAQEVKEGVKKEVKSDVEKRKRLLNYKKKH